MLYRNAARCSEVQLLLVSRRARTALIAVCFRDGPNHSSNRRIAKPRYGSGRQWRKVNQDFEGFGLSINTTPYDTDSRASFADSCEVNDGFDYPCAGEAVLGRRKFRQCYRRVASPDGVDRTKAVRLGA